MLQSFLIYFLFYFTFFKCSIFARMLLERLCPKMKKRVRLAYVDPACEDLLVVFVVFLKKLGSVELVGTFGAAAVAVNTVLCLLHLVLPVFV